MSIKLVLHFLYNDLNFIKYILNKKKNKKSSLIFFIIYIQI